MSTADHTEELWVPWIDRYVLPKSDPRYLPADPALAYSVQPDIPHGVGFTLVDAGYDDQVDIGNKMATTHFLIAVSLADKGKILNAIPYASVPEKTRMLVQMNTACNKDWNGTTEAFFATISNLAAGSVALKQIAKELLEQARPRGLSAITAEKIRGDYDLPPLASISG